MILTRSLLGERAAWRAEVVPRQTTSGRGEGACQEPAAAPAYVPQPTETARREARGRCWASLMARTFACDVRRMTDIIRGLTARGRRTGGTVFLRAVMAPFVAQFRPEDVMTRSTRRILLSLAFAATAASVAVPRSPSAAGR